MIYIQVICCSYHDEHADKAFHMMANTVEAVRVITIWRRCFSTSTREYFWLPRHTRAKMHSAVCRGCIDGTYIHSWWMWGMVGELAYLCA